MSDDINIPGDEAYLSFGGWAKAMANPPAPHERRRFIVDTECVAAGMKTSEKGDRFTRSLAILRVIPIEGYVVKPADADEGPETPPMFNDDGTVADEASADEGDEIRAEMDEARAAATEEAEEAAPVDDNDPAADPWPGDADASVPPAPNADTYVDPDAAAPATGNDGSGNVTNLFKEATGE